MSPMVSFAYAHPRLSAVGLAAAGMLIVLRSVAEIVRALT